MGVPSKVKDLILGDVVTWTHYGSTVSPVILGKILSFSSSLYLRGPDKAILNHANTYPAIPLSDAVIDDYRSYNYIVIEMQTGISYVGPNAVPIMEVREIGIPWIVPHTVLRETRDNLVITINDFNSADLAKVKTLLTANGYTQYTLKESLNLLVIEIIDFDKNRMDSIRRILVTNGFTNYRLTIKTKL